MRCGHLFNGISGFGLAAHWMGWQNVWHSEIDEYCNKIMNRHFPNSTNYGDIKKADWTKAEAVDLISGGFPCQPYSQAGERRGKEDERHLWPEMLEVISIIKPRWVVAENVYGIVNWNEGLVFEEIQDDLEDEGYEVQSYILPASAVNAPHRRNRTWFVAYSAEQRLEGSTESGQRSEHSRSKRSGGKRDATNTSSDRLQGRSNQGELREERSRAEQRSENLGKFPRRQWENFPTTPPVCGGNDGLSNRVDRIKALGNAIVPQVALQIFKAIEKYEEKYA